MNGVRCRRLGKIVEVTIDRPKANAIDATTSRELGRVFEEFRDDDGSLVAIITGSGDRFFSAGWDLKSGADDGALPDQRPGGDFGPGGFAGITELPGLYKPIIAAVNGAAVGGGCEIVLACDLVIAAEHASFGVPEVKFGVMADAGGVQRLARRVPHNVAMEMLLAGRRLSADEARQFGLVSAVVSSGELMRAAHQLAEAICEGAPLAIQAVKQIVNESEGMPTAAIFGDMRKGRYGMYDKALKSEDAKEGPRAFAAKRRPVFQGR